MRRPATETLGVNIERNDWLLLDRHAAETGKTLADLARSPLEPLPQKLRGDKS